MTGFVFKPSRVKNGKRVVSRLYSGRYRRPGQSKMTTVALHVSDKQAAEEKLRAIIRDLERQEMGIGVPKRIRDAAECSIHDHVKNYCADLRARNRDGKYIATSEKRLSKLAIACNWRRLTDVTAESFQTWRAKQTLAAKTLNDYLAEASALFSWLERTEVVRRNPLKRVGKVEARGNERRKRRAFTPKEFQAVVAISRHYRLALLTAYYTGLRRNELKQLEWADIQETDDGSFIVTRASTTKNHKTQRVYIPRWFADELTKAKPQDALGSVPVFPPGRVPTMWVFRRLLREAAVPYKDDQGRQADFHALRKSLNTHLANAGVDPQTRKEIMRHSAISLTLDVYTDKGMLPMAAAVEKLPIFPKQMNSQIHSHNPDFSGRALSFEDAETLTDEVLQMSQDEERKHAAAPTDAVRQNCENGSSGRIRTYDQSVNSRPLYH
jgi:integrase